ncbi:mannitol-1-phosphate 5-dehydrogenase [Brevibacillus thermoruber]|jgi:mannitol-1-phosphate 5-dehydrogenase|uniref:Mannitol-1-phosphate 5-dehydrogenase n=1 Tax=Brevibacillus thermoruber TaxID=33942 RepID=A0A9X3Z4F6_9BACL|nr:mannitol-1-phosphate 5-dehydrogenase [Brevibacillus thermoruber]MDA5109758.1 mannitol-1-phosphate 5-dehydrogenase [Brevibacillus thermoruber]
MLAVHFGAGNIGRGFIGQLLHQAGYEVCFIDVNQELVDEINSRKAYSVQLAMEGTPVSVVEGVRAIHGQDTEAVAQAIADADLVTTAVGPNVLPHIAPAIAAGITRRITHTDRPLNVIACENMIGGSAQLKTHVFAQLDEAVRAKAEELVGFPNAAVDRIVPLQKHEDKLLVTVEPFFEWAVDQSHIIGDIPQIEGVTYVNDLTPYIERKLYTVNTGHAMIAYLGYQMGYAAIDEAIRDDEILRATRQALQETGALLVAKHGFDKGQHKEYVEKILGRFANPYITDQVTRVGRSPIRKLAPQDRLVGPAMQCFDHGIVPEHLGLGIAAALLFDFREDPEAVQLTEDIQRFGLEHVLKTYTGIRVNHALFSIVMNHARELQARRKTN